MARSGDTGDFALASARSAADDAAVPPSSSSDGVVLGRDTWTPRRLSGLSGFLNICMRSIMRRPGVRGLRVDGPASTVSHSGPDAG